MSQPGSVVVVGGGVAGFSVCAELRRLGYDGALTVLDAGSSLHDRPPLSKDYLLGACDDAAIALAQDRWFAEHRIEVHTRAVVTGLTLDPLGVATPDVALAPADVVVLATGGDARPLPVAGADHPAVHVLRRVEDARGLRLALVPGARALIVGGGLIGAEVASTAVALGATVTLIDPLDPPLAEVVGTQIAQRLHTEHGRRGITVLQAGVERLVDESGAVRALLSDGRSVVADVVVVGIGMVPSTALAEAAGLDVDRGVLVDDRQRTSLPGAYGVGDCSRRVGPDRVPLAPAEHWEAALIGGQVAAADILGQHPPPVSAPWFWSDRHGEHLEVVGSFTRRTATVVRGDQASGPFVAFGLVGDLVVGAVSVDDPRATRVARRLIDRQVPVDLATLADPATDLRRLLRQPG